MSNDTDDNYDREKYDKDHKCEICGKPAPFARLCEDCMDRKNPS